MDKGARDGVVRPLLRPVITGASGHIGANLVRALVARGIRPRVLVHHDRRALEGLDVEIIADDVLDPASLAAAFGATDVVYHLAARISIVEHDEPQTRAVNVDGTRNVVEACLHAKVRRLVHFSSIHALSTQPVDAPVDETRPLTEHEPVPHYDRSKADGEREVLAGVARGLDAVILNPTAVIGPHDYGPSYMGEVLLDLFHRRLPGLVVGGFDWVDARDVVAGALAAAERGRCGERYLLSGHRATMHELAQLVEELTGRRAPRMVAPMWLARTSVPFAAAFARLARKGPRLTSASLHALRNHKHVVSARAASELGHAPRPLRESVADTLAWFRSAGQL
jgi:dihydroflavonol-4-reductase